MSEIVNEHLKYRKLIWSFAKTDLVKTYRGSALGWSWAIISPLIRICIYWFAFSIGLRSSGPKYGYPFVLWLVVGLLPWFYMSDMIIKGTTVIVKYKYLVTKVTFPVSIIPTFSSISKFLVHLFLLLIVVIMFIFKGYNPDVYYLQLPFYMVSMFVFFTRWSLFASPLAAVSRDFGNLVKSFVTAIFWLSGILWDPMKVSSPWLKTILNINPVTYFSQGYRNVFINKTWFYDDINTLYFICTMMFMTIISSIIYKRLRKEIPDVL